MNVPTEIINDAWWHEHWEMYLGFGTAFVVTSVTALRLVLRRYATKHFVKTSIIVCRADVEGTDNEILRRQEKCVDDLNAAIDRLSLKIDRAVECSGNKIDNLYKIMLEMHQR